MQEGTSTVWGSGRLSLLRWRAQRADPLEGALGGFTQVSFPTLTPAHTHSSSLFPMPTSPLQIGKDKG